MLLYLQSSTLHFRNSTYNTWRLNLRSEAVVRMRQINGVATLFGDTILVLLWQCNSMGTIHIFLINGTDKFHVSIQTPLIQAKKNSVFLYWTQVHLSLNFISTSCCKQLVFSKAFLFWIDCSIGTPTPTIIVRKIYGRWACEAANDSYRWLHAKVNLGCLITRKAIYC